MRSDRFWPLGVNASFGIPSLTSIQTSLYFPILAFFLVGWASKTRTKTTARVKLALPATKQERVKLANFKRDEMPEKSELGQVGQTFLRIWMEDLIRFEDSNRRCVARCDRRVLRQTSSINFQSDSIVARPPPMFPILGSPFLVMLPTRVAQTFPRRKCWTRSVNHQCCPRNPIVAQGFLDMYTNSFVM